MVAWAVLELTPRGEKENPSVIEKAIQRVFPGAEVYIPATETQIGDDQVVHYLMHGYAFVKDYPTRTLRTYQKLAGTKYINSVLAKGSRPATVDSSYIEEMREQVRAEVNQGIGIGDTVMICSGPYKAIEATVLVDLPETKEVQVFVQLRSKQALLTLPRSVLKVVDRAPLSPFFARVGYLRAWANLAKVLLKYDPPHDRLLEAFEAYSQISQWLRDGAKLFAFVNSETLDRKMVILDERYDQFVRVNRWMNRGSRLFTFVTYRQESSATRLAELRQKFLELSWFETVDDRLQQLSRDVEALSREGARTRKNDKNMTFQNVLVDGHNLAHRCFHAPGMNVLADSKGRPTGVITGVLKSLGSLRKRFPEANFWVAWDGSSQRRKARYGAYKEGRKTAKFAEQLDVIKEVLPRLGVRQVWNPQEEADDIIGTLVKNDLADERNLIFSTDRDFMQLVGDTTLLLVPAIGSRREIFFDPATVEKAMGVPPEKVVQLRAFFGDDSDNLPGVPRVPKKVLKALLVSHGSVTGVYSSGLAGLTRGQYERLRVAESQVRINLDLMALVDVEVTRTDPDVDVEAAGRLLREYDIDPDPIAEAFFGRRIEASGE